MYSMNNHLLLMATDDLFAKYIGRTHKLIQKNTNSLYIVIYLNT